MVLTVLRLEGVEKTFHRGTPNERVALKKLDLTLSSGEFCIVIGGNGAGKSTLLNLIAGTMFPDAGWISVEGQDITWTPEHRRAALIGRIFQDPMLGTAGSLTIEENLAIAMARGRRRRLSRAPKESDRKYFRDQLAMLGLGLENRLQTKVATLSGGQRQSLSLMMAILQRPKVLLLDEHTAALDPRTARLILRLTDQVVRDHDLTALMVTHSLEHALAYGDRTIMMQEGEVVLDVKGMARKSYTIDSLLAEYSKVRGERLVDDRILTTKKG